jgi:hypothetical protein
MVSVPTRVLISSVALVPLLPDAKPDSIVFW